MPDLNGALSGAFDEPTRSLRVTTVAASSTDTPGASRDANGVWDAVFENGRLRVVEV